MSRFTIAICTRDRPELLGRCLAGLGADLGGSDAPVVVVDNSDHGSAAPVVAAYTDGFPIVLVREPVAGLSRARNRAVEACRTPYLAFLDDDAIQVAGWTAALGAALERWQPAVVGGPILPLFDGPRPAWFRDRDGSSHLDYAEGPLPPGSWLSGGNMAWRVDLVRALGGFPVALGMVGGRMGYGEETFLQARLRAEYPHAQHVFTAAMAIRHLVAAEKMTVGYWLRRSWVHGLQDPQIFPGIRVTLREAVGQAAMLVALVLWTPFRRRWKHPFWQNWVMTAIAPRVRFWGRVVGLSSNVGRGRSHRPAMSAGGGNTVRAMRHGRNTRSGRG